MTSATYLLPPSEQPDHVDGLPLGTRGGMKFRHNFPADGEYRFTIRRSRHRPLFRGCSTRPTRVLILVDGREVFRGELGGTEDQRTVDRKGAPGRAEVIEAVRQPSGAGEGGHLRRGGDVHRARPRPVGRVRRLPAGRRVQPRRSRAAPGGRRQGDGPFNSPGVSDTPSRRKIFVCRPDGKTPERACARRIARRGHAVARVRRPVTERRRRCA